MLNKENRPRRHRAMLGIIIVVFVIIFIFITLPSPNKSEVKEVADYKIVKFEEFPIGRYVLRIVTKTLDKDQLKQIGITVIEQLKKEYPFNAVTVFIYDKEEFIEDAFTLARIVYAPWGDWGKAMDVSTGDYSKMQYQFEIKDKIPENQLTDFEASIVKQWHDIYYSLEDQWYDTHDVTDTTGTDSLLYEQMATDSVAVQNNITSDEVDRIKRKYLDWLF